MILFSGVMDYQKTDQYEKARNRMVDSQIADRGITGAVRTPEETETALTDLINDTIADADVEAVLYILFMRFCCRQASGNDPFVIRDAQSARRFFVQ